jgi:hypothetical protein
VYKALYEIDSSAVPKCFQSTAVLSFPCMDGQRAYAMKLQKLYALGDYVDDATWGVVFDWYTPGQFTARLIYLLALLRAAGIVHGSTP